MTPLSFRTAFNPSLSIWQPETHARFFDPCGLRDNAINDILFDEVARGTGSAAAPSELRINVALDTLPYLIFGRFYFPRAYVVHLRGSESASSFHCHQE